MAIVIIKSHKGRFTAKAKNAGLSVQAYANRVLSHPKQYPDATRKQAQFAKNATKFNH